MMTTSRPARIFVAMAATLAFLVACQSTSSDPTPTTQAVTVPVTVGAVSRIPDSVAWHAASSSGSRSVRCSTLTCSQEFELKAALGATDTFFIDLWKLGVLAGTVKFISVNGSTTLKAVGSTPNTLDVKLLESFSLFQASKDSLKNAKASDLVAYYAKLLLDSSAVYTGVDIPTGMSPWAVKQAVVLLSSQRGLTSVQLQAKGILGLSTDSIRVYVSLLVKASQITDTTVLFPVSPLWIQTDLSVGNLTQGGDAVAVTGGFAWKKPRNITNAVVEIRNADGREDSSVRTSFLNSMNPTDGSWIFTKNLTLQALMGAKVGTDTLVATLSDDSGHTVTARATFEVLRGDTLAPSITVLDPPSDTTVDNQVSSFVLRIEATDNKKVAGVKIGSATFDAAPYVDTVDLAVGGNVIVIDAWDASGNHSTKNVVILRSKAAEGSDTTKPVVKFTNPSADIDVSFSTKDFDLAWKATDEVGVTKVTLDGEPVSGSSDSYGKTVPLVVGSNSFTVKAYDASGNLDSQTIRITRLPDPTVVGIVPLPDRNVSSEQDTALLSWTLTHPEQATSVSLDGQPLALSGAKATKSVSLSTGPNTFILTVKDSSGKSVSDTVVVTRASDATGPSIAWISPSKPLTVDATVTSYPVRVKVTDPSGVDSVQIQGKKAAIDSGDIWIATLPLPQPDGVPVVVRVQAWDKKKNSSSDSAMSVTRSVPDGTEKPTIALVQPSTATGNALVFDSAFLHVQAKITGTLIAVDPTTVFFNNVAAKQQGDLYSADVPVPATGTGFTITIKASNTSKNGNTLDLTVTRAKDTVDPVITPSANTKSQTVPFDTKTFDLSWTISDNDSLATLKFNGSVEPTAGTLKKTVDLAVGTDTFTLVATDRAGNSSTSQIFLTRSPDLVAPALDILSPSQDTTLPYGTASIAVQTKATDAGSGIKSVAVNGVLADKSGVATVSLTANKVNLITAIALDSAGNADTATVNATVMGIVATPTFSPIAGTYTTAQTVTLASATAGAAIYYTTDGTAPTSASSLYSTPIAVTGSLTIKAIAIKSGLSNSTIGTADYVIKPLAGTPAFSPLPNITYLAAQTVTITSTTSGASIYYTTDGSAPTTSSTLYTGPLTLGSSDTLRAIAVKPGLTNSAVGTAIYTIIDVTLKSVVLNGTVNIPVTGADLRSDSLAAFSDVAISATPSDSTAAVTMNRVTPIKMISEATTVLITVTKGTASRVYILTLIPRQAGTFKDARDNNTYRAVKIGSQWWMAQNLNYAGLLDTLGTCYTDSCDQYGRGYLSVDDVLASATPSTKNPSGVQGICPSGWHLPSEDEWIGLALAAAGSNDTTAGIQKLKSKASTAAWIQTTKGPGPTAQAVSTDHSGTDEFGFTIIPLQFYGTGSSGGSQSLNFAGFYTSSGYIQFFDGITSISVSQSPRMSVRCRMD